MDYMFPCSSAYFPRSLSTSVCCKHALVLWVYGAILDGHNRLGGVTIESTQPCFFIRPVHNTNCVQPFIVCVQQNTRIYVRACVLIFKAKIYVLLFLFACLCASVFLCACSLCVSQTIHFFVCSSNFISIYNFNVLFSTVL